MANYTYKLENGEYVFYEDDKVLNPQMMSLSRLPKKGSRSIF